jgi:Na+/H+ antiporter NhaC
MYTKNNNIQILKSRVQILVFGILFFFIGISSNAQCAMCRAALSGESNIKKAEAVNDGIVYLMVIPYLLVAIIGVLIYRMYQSKKKAE